MLRWLSLLSIMTAAAAAQTLPADRPAAAYDEPLRPQFHFTARTNWLNDPNGLVFFAGEYHLFFQHNPSGLQSGNLTWGHAVSPDLVHWRQLDNALVPDALGPIWSGSAVVDRENTAGFQTGSEPPLVAIYTAAGDTSPESKGKPFTQCVAFSNDRGRTWTKYDRNPVLPNVAPPNRDPKLVWHAPTRRWIMALYRERSDFALLSSPDLKTWLHLQDLTIPGSDECPDFFEMPLDGDARNTRWVFTSANGHYLVGTFDGRHFSADFGPYPSDHGANYYAVQSYSDAPDGRRIQIAWMRDGKYPGMPFNQQMSFPCELSLRTTPAGPRLFRQPVREIEPIHGKSRKFEKIELSPGSHDPLGDLAGDCFDVAAELLPRDAATKITFTVRGHALTYRAATHELTFGDRSMPLHPDRDGRVRLRLLVDRTSLEVFADDGASVMSSCFIPAADARPLAVRADGGAATIPSMDVHALKSAWSQ